MSLAALITEGVDGVLVKLGTSSAPPDPGDTGVTDPVDAVVVSTSVADVAGDAVITIDWSLGEDDGNGSTLAEVGLYVLDELGAEVLVTRQLLAAPVPKTSLIEMTGALVTTISLTVIETPLPESSTMALMNQSFVLYNTATAVQVSNWSKRPGTTVKVSAWYKWSAELAGPVALEFRADSGTAALHEVILGSLTWPGDAEYRLAQESFSADLLTEDHGALWLRRKGTAGSVYVTNTIVEMES